MSALAPKAIGLSTHQVGGAEQTIQPNANLDIPRQAVSDPKKKDRRRDHTGETSGWQNGEQVVTEQGAIRARARDDWQQFSGDRNGRGRNFGSVEIDSPVVKLADLAPKPPKVDQPRTGWEKLAKVHGDAADFEETHRPHGEVTGREDDLHASDQQPGVRRRPTNRRHRRRYTVVYPA